MTAAPPLTGFRLQALAIAMGLGGLLQQILRLSPVTFATTLEAEFGLGATGIAALSSAFFLGFSVAILPGGLLIDRFGPRPVLAAGGALVGLAAFAFAGLDNAVGLGAARFAMGMGAAPLGTATLVLLRTIGEPSAFSRLTGEESAIGRSGALLATGPLMAAVALFGWRVSIAAVGACALAWAMAMTRVPRAGPGDPTRRRIVAELVEILKDGRVLAALLLEGAMAAAAFTIMGLWGPPWLAASYGINPVGQGVAMTLMTAAFALAALVWAQIAARLGARTMMAVTSAIAIALLAAAAYGLPDPWLVHPWCALLGLALGSTPVLTPVVDARVAPMLRARALSLVSLAFMGSIFIAQTLSGVLIDQFAKIDGHHPPQAFAWLLAVLAGFVTLGWIAFDRASRGR